jgi:RNA polymerase sigma factor (sigma-70 family)
VTPRRLIEPARLAGSAVLHSQTDERLVDLARAGNDRAFEVIVARYRRPLLRYCRQLLPPERAEDAVQQAFLNAYRAIGAGQAELNLRPWLYRVAHNASVSLLRQNGWSHEELDEGFDGVQQPPQAFEQRERVREVVRAVQALPARQRDAMVLRELEGRSYEEIAAELGVTGGAVRQLLNRARTSLRAGATAVTPLELTAWLAARGPGGVPAGERVAELCAGAGAGGLATAAKLGTVLVMAGAVAGGTGPGPLPSVIGGGAEASPEEAEAAEPRERGVGGAGAGAGPGGPGGAGGPDGERGRDGARGRDGRGDARDGSERDDPRSGDDGSAGSGSGSSGSGSDSSGSGSSSDSSGSGSGGSGSGSDSSGSGSDSGSSRSGSSGSGSGSDSSGSGSSGSGSGSDSSGSGSGSDSSGSGSSSSGSGSDSSGSGSDEADSSGSGSSGSGSGSSGSGWDSSGSGSG